MFIHKGVTWENSVSLNIIASFILFFTFFFFFISSLNKTEFAVTRMFHILSNDGKCMTAGLQTLLSITEQAN